MIQSVILAGKATYAELETVLSTEDLFDLYEIVTVEHHNQVRLKNWQQQPNG